MWKLVVPLHNRMLYPWAPGEFIEKIERMLDELAGKHVVQQLRDLRVQEFFLFHNLFAKAEVQPHDAGNFQIFQIFLRIDREAHWPVDVGHELGHILLGGGAQDKAELLCEYFGFCWAADENNFREITELLQPFSAEASKRRMGFVMDSENEEKWKNRALHSGGVLMCLPGF